jgi:hypothetical protein
MRKKMKTKPNRPFRPAGTKMCRAQVTFDARLSVGRLRRKIAKMTHPNAVCILAFLQEQRIEFGIGHRLIVNIGSRVRRIFGRA